jgi:hypothetical protein
MEHIVQEWINKVYKYQIEAINTKKVTRQENFMSVASPRTYVFMTYQDSS